MTLDYSTMTKANLLAALEEKSAELDRAERRVSPPVAVPEAVALAACIRGLDVYTDSINRNGQQSTSWRSQSYRDVDSYTQSGPERILRALAAKYGVNLFTTTTEPCSRAHVDQLNPTSVLLALGGQVGL